MAEQVVKMRGGLANIESLGAGGLGGGGCRSCEQFRFNGTSNTTKLWYFNHNTKLFNYQHVKMTGLAYFCMQC